MSRPPRFVFIIRCAALAALACSGCAPVGAIVNKVVPEPPVPARYVPNKTAPVLVLVENYRNPAAARMDAQRVAMHVADELREYRIAPVVDPADAEALRSRPDYHLMKVEEVGRAAGAGQVLYVNFQKFDTEYTTGGEMVKGSAEMRVRLVDAHTGQTLWPRSLPEGHPVVAESPWVRTPTGDREGTSEPQLRDQVARRAAHEIVKLFRPWRQEDEEQDLEETVR